MTVTATPRNQSIRPGTRIWLGLLALTATTYAIGKSDLGGTQIVLLVLIITFIKGEMVAGYFMGLRKTSLMWRAIMASWLVIVGSGIAIAYLMGLH